MKVVKFSEGIIVNNSYNASANLRPVCISTNENGAIVSLDGNISITGDQNVISSLSLCMFHSLNYEYNNMYYDPNANTDDPILLMGVNQSWYEFSATQKGRFTIENLHVPYGYTLFLMASKGTMYRCYGVQY